VIVDGALEGGAVGRPIWRLVRVIGAGALVLAVVLGTIWLSQADILPLIPGDREMRELLAQATPTLYPTLLPATSTPPPTAASPGPDASGVVAQTTPLVESLTPEASPTLEATTVEPTPCVPPQGWVAYTVQEGDTLYSLAQSSSTNLQGLLQGNCLDEALELQAGMRLYRPVVAQATATPSEVCRRGPPGWSVIVVRPGETLHALSIRYGTTVRALQSANCLSSDLIMAGYPLYVPPWIVVPPTPPPTIIWWTPTPMVTDTPAPTPTATLTEVPTMTPTATLTPSPTPTPTETPVLIPTWTPWPSATPTAEPTLPPTSTPEPTPTLTGTEVLPSVTPTPTVETVEPES